MASFVGSRVLGLLRDIAIGYAFGTSPELDAYLAAFRIPDTLFQLLAGAALGSAFVPVFTGYLARDQEREGWLLANSVLNAILAALVLATLAAFIFTPTLLGWMVHGFTPEQLELTVELTRIMLLSPVIFGASGLLMAILNARQHFLWPAVAPMLYNLSIMAGALFLAGDLGVRGLALAVVVGAVLHLLVQVPELRRQGMRYAPAIAWRLSGFRRVLALMGPRIFGLAAVQLNFAITILLASTLQGGSLSALNYAFLIMMAPLGVFGMAISTAVFPTMAEQVARHEYDQLRATLSEALRLILFLTLPAIAFLIVLREPVVGLLFQRGAFDDWSRQVTASALLFYALGLAGHATIEITTRVFYAVHDTRTPVLLGLGSMVTYLVLGNWLIGPLDVGGLALALSIAASLEAILLLLLASRRLGSIGERALGRSVLRTSLATLGLTACCGIGLWLGSRVDGGPTGWLLSVGVSLLLGAPVYLGFAWVSGSQELRSLVHQLARRFG
jgi:putative peptidoglycan lipid II flippase